LLLDDVAAGIRVLHTRDGVDVSEEQVLERARNIVAGLIGNYSIRSLDAGGPRDPRGARQLDLVVPPRRSGRARR
jgi:hypothetical protein